MPVLRGAPVMMCMRCSSIIGLSGRLDQHRLRDAVYVVVNRHPQLVARFSGQFDEPVQIVPADPWVPWRYVDIDAEGGDVEAESRLSGCVRPSAPRCVIWVISRFFGRC